MIKISTEKLKKAVVKAEKGAGKNILNPITEMIGIRIQNDTMYLNTTDKTNDFEVTLNGLNESEDCNITVKCESFSKLISKTTSDTITLKIEDNILHINGNGNYKIPIEVDENGFIEFPRIIFDRTNKEKYEVELSTIKSMTAVNKNSLALTFENPYLTGYFVNDKILTCDGGCGSIVINERKFSDLNENLLLNSDMINLLSLSNSDIITMIKDDNKLYFYNDEMIVFGAELNNKEDYPVEAIESYLNKDFPNKCKITKQLIVNALDRLQIFTDKFDKSVTLNFNKNNLLICSNSTKSTEEISYTELTENEEFSCKIDLFILKEQLSTCPVDSVQLHYGLENALRVTYENVTQIMSLLE